MKSMMNKSQSLFICNLNKIETKFLISVIMGIFYELLRKNKIDTSFKYKFFNWLI